MTTKKLISGTYFIKGAKWWDKVNGNTYYSAYIINNKGKVIHYINYQYGYGTAYTHEALKWLNENKRKNAKIDAVDLGAEYMKQKNVKNWWY